MILTYSNPRMGALRNSRHMLALLTEPKFQLASATQELIWEQVYLDDAALTAAGEQL